MFLQILISVSPKPGFKVNGMQHYMASWPVFIRNFGSFVDAMLKYLKYQAHNTKLLLLGLSMHRKISCITVGGAI